MLFLGAFGTPVAIAVGYFANANAGWLFAITGLWYFLSYEYLHLAYHLPESHWVSRLPFMDRLKRLHTVNHDQTRITHANFNITTRSAIGCSARCASSHNAVRQTKSAVVITV